MLNHDLWFTKKKQSYKCISASLLIKKSQKGYLYVSFSLLQAFWHILIRPLNSCFSFWPNKLWHVVGQKIPLFHYLLQGDFYCLSSTTIAIMQQALGEQRSSKQPTTINRSLMQYVKFKFYLAKLVLCDLKSTFA